MQINPILKHSLNANFKNSTQKSSKYPKVVEKQAYIEAKTENLENLVTLGFLGTFASGVYDINSFQKDKGLSKISIILLIATTSLLIAKWVKQIQLSKRYEKENGYDTKNYA